MRIVASLLLMALFMLGIVFLEKQPLEEVVPSSFLPADTLVYAEQKSGVEAIQQFRNSRMGQALASIDFVQVLQEAEMEPAHLAIVDKTLATLRKLQDDRLVQALLGRQCTLALFAQRDWSAKADSVEEFIADHLLLISEPRINTVALDVLTSHYTGNVDISIVPYGEYLIKRFYVNDEVISVVLTDGFILASLEERILREALDLHDKKIGTLKTNTEFQVLTKALGDSERLLYFSVDGLQVLAEYGADHASTPREQAMLSELSSLKGVTALAHGVWRSKELLKNTLLVKLNREKMNSQVKEMIATSPSINDTLPFVARDVLFYYWSNTLSIRLLWEMYVAEAGENDKDIQSVRNTIHDISGYDLKDIMEMISGNVSILVQQSERAQFVPIPDLALLVKLKDSEQLGQVLAQSLQKLDINVQSRTYKNITYYYWGLYPQESLQPVYAIHRNYLIIANTLDILKGIIDTPVNNSGLVTSSEFMTVDPGFQTLNNSVCYIDQASLLRHLSELIGWAGTILAIQDQQAAEKSKILIDNLINPLISGIAMYDKSATRTYLKDDRIVIESQTRIHP